MTHVAYDSCGTPRILEFKKSQMEAGDLDGDYWRIYETMKTMKMKL